MKTYFRLFVYAAIFVLSFSGNLFAQDSTNVEQKKKVHNPLFIDKDGDGYNDNAPDHDGDGIPNGLDPDWQKLKKEKNKKKRRFIDLDGDGVDDNLQLGDPKNQNMDNPLDGKGSSMEGKQQKAKGRERKKHGKK